MSIPRTATGGVAEKATACWENPIQGNRQVSGVCLLEAMPVILTYQSAVKAQG